MEGWLLLSSGGPGMLLKDMLKSRRNTSELNVGMVNNADAFMCQTPDLANSIKYGQLFVVGIYEEQCLVGRSMTSSGWIYVE